MLLTAIRIELLKIFHRWRTYIGFATIGLLVPIIMLLARKFGFDVQYGDFRKLQDSFIFVGSLVNGLLISYYMMNVLWVHFPFFIILVAGDIVAGEGAAGTFRILLTRPISRWQVMVSKFCATLIYTAALVFFMGAICIGTGILILGGGDLLVFDQGVLILAQSDALLRFLLAYSLAVWVQLTVAALAFLLSTLSNNSVGPIIGTYAVIAVSLILSVLRIPALSKIRPWLFTSYFEVFFKPFSDPIPWAEIAADVTRLGLFIAVFFFISLLIFQYKDIRT
jgi:ABC-2 type transport system permease protein